MDDYLEDYAAFTAPFDFSVKVTDSCGKRLVADRALPAGEELIEEVPLVCWPSSKTLESGAPFCDRCLRILDRPAEAVPCDSCTAQFCSSDCKSAAEAAHSFLCPGALPALRQWQADHNPAAPITLESVARCLAHLAASTASYIATHDIPAEVAYFNAVRPFSRLVAPPGVPIEGLDLPAATATLRTSLAARLEAALGPQVAATLLDEEFLRTLVGQLVLNSQAIQIQKEVVSAVLAADEPATSGSRPAEQLWVEGAGVYVLQSCINHSCDPNADIVWGSDSSIVLRTTKPVPAGAELTISYIPLELPLKARRELLANYFFDCRCARCTAEAGAGLTVGPVRLGPTARPARRTPKAGLAAD